MKRKVFCAICGRKGTVEIADGTGRILDKDWRYYGKMSYPARIASRQEVNH